MRNVYSVKLAKAVKVSETIPSFGSRETTHVYVVASTFAAAQEAVERKYPTAVVRGIDVLNYNDVPIVVGD